MDEPAQRAFEEPLDGSEGVIDECAAKPAFQLAICPFSFSHRLSPPLRG